MFLHLNDTSVDLPDDEAFDLVMRVAEGELDVEEIASTLRREP